MTIGELIKELEKFNQDAEVYAHSHDYGQDFVQHIEWGETEDKSLGPEFNSECDKGKAKFVLIYAE